MPRIKEVLYEKDDIIKAIYDKFDLEELQFFKCRSSNDLWDYCFVAPYEEDFSEVVKAMEEMDYYMAQKNIKVIQGEKYNILFFEYLHYPDITDEVKEKYEYLYHWAPDYRKESIIEKGLIPIQSDYPATYKYPPRVFLWKGDSPYEEKMFPYGRRLCGRDRDPNNDGNWTLYKIDIKKLPDNVRFYWDPTYDWHVDTDQGIPYSAMIPWKEVKFNIRYADVIVRCKDEILLLRKPGWDYIRFFCECWCLPGGTMDKADNAHEICIETARRELWEEAGIYVELDKLKEYINVRYSPFETATIYEVVLNEKPEIKLSEEHDNYAWVKLNDLDDYKFIGETKERLKQYFKEND